MYEVIRLCGLQAAFRASGFPSRSGPHARLGTAVHRALELIWRKVPHVPASEALADFRRLGFAIFRDCVNDERHAAAANAREQDLPWPEKKVQEAEIQIGLAAGRMLEDFRKLQSTTEVAGASEAETVLTSRDGTIRGQPDLVIREASGRPLIIDYKSGALGDAEKNERYARQLHFYAFLWHEVHDEWAEEGLLVNPMTGARVKIRLSPKRALELAADAMARLDRIESEEDVSDLAIVGQHCSLCSYRQWCEPYWGVSRDQPAPESRADIEGIVLRVDALASDPTRGVKAVLVLSTAQGEITLRGERSPAALLHVHPGAKVRILDATVDESPNILRMTSWTEVAIQ
jgi:CRISPR/Cas system-associated exonuclease Cas4 (RecB family)